MTPALTQKLNRGTFVSGASNSTERTPPERRAFLSSTFDSYRLWRESGNKKPLRRKYPGLSLSGLKLPLPAGHSKPFLVANINANREGCNMTQLITIDDLNTTVNHEPRLLDTIVGKRLGYNRPRVIRELIERCKDELETYGSIAVRHGAYRGHETTEYYLNEGQCLVLCALSRTPQAATVRKAIIEVFMAHRRGALDAIQDHDGAQRFNTDQLIQIDTIVQRALIQHERRMERRSSDTGQRLAALDSWFKKFPAPERRLK